MLNNRSVPTNMLLPHLVYQDVDAAVEWLSRVFSFQEHYRHGGPPSNGAQMHFGGAWIMLSRAREGRAAPDTIGSWTQSLTVFLEGVEQHFERSKAAGARVIEEPHETVYGEFQYAALDLEGHLWLFSRHARDVKPEEWGARVAAS
jgi:uncharacterized glyoxalase superfamily protein PhnB